MGGGSEVLVLTEVEEDDKLVRRKWADRSTETTADVRNTELYARSADGITR